MKTTGSRPHLTRRALGALAALLVMSFASGLAQPSSAHAASAGWYAHQLDRDGCWDAIQWWTGSRWTGHYWVDTNNDCVWGETYVVDNDWNGTGDLFYLRRANSGNWSSMIDVVTGRLFRGENQWSYGGYQYDDGYGGSWSSQGYYQATVGPPSNPSGAYNLALAFARQGYVN
jgi:hypothetical protein